MEPSIFAGLLEQLGTAGLAGFAIYMLFQSFKDKQIVIEKSEAAAERYAQNERSDKLLILAAFDKNTEVRAVNTTKIDTLLQITAENAKSLEEIKNAKSAA